MEQRTICVNCGRELSGMKKFCPYCGAALSFPGTGPSRNEIYDSGGDYQRSSPPNGSSTDMPPYGYWGGMEEPPEKGGGEKILFGVLIALLCMTIIAVSAVVIIRMTGKRGITTAETTNSEAEATEYVSYSGADGNDEEDLSGDDEDPDSDMISEELPDKPDGTQPSYLTIKNVDKGGHSLYKNSTGDAKVKTDNEYESDKVPEAVFVAWLGERDGRAKIYYAGFTGWVDEDEIEYFSDDVYYLYDGHLSEKIYQAFKYKGGLHTHKKASNSKASLRSDKYRIPYGKTFTVKKIKKGFAKIRYKGKDCWVDMHYFRTYAHKTEDWIVDTQEKNKNYIWIRKKKDLNSKDYLAKIWNGERIKVSNIKDGWGRVTYDNGKTGWVDMKRLTPEAP